MRTLNRQMRPIYYANNSEDIVDEWGNATKGYGQPVEYDKASVGYQTGRATNNGFGKSFDYDLELVTADMDCPIDEYSHLWVDVSTDKDHDYEVMRKLPTLNCVRYGCNRVNVHE